MNGPWNRVPYNNPKFDELVREARRTPDAAKQKALYADAMPLLANESGWIVPQWGDRIWPAKARLQGVALDFINNADFSEAWLS